MAETLKHGKNCYIRMVRMVTIIHLPEAPNPKVGPPTLHQPRTAPTYTIVSSSFLFLGGGGSEIVF